MYLYVTWADDDVQIQSRSATIIPGSAAQPEDGGERVVSSCRRKMYEQQSEQRAEESSAQPSRSADQPIDRSTRRARRAVSRPLLSPLLLPSFCGESGFLRAGVSAIIYNSPGGS